MGHTKDRSALQQLACSSSPRDDPKAGEFTVDRRKANGETGDARFCADSSGADIAVATQSAPTDGAVRERAFPGWI